MSQFFVLALLFGFILKFFINETETPEERTPTSPVSYEALCRDSPRFWVTFLYCRLILNQWRKLTCSCPPLGSIFFFISVFRKTTLFSLLQLLEICRIVTAALRTVSAGSVMSAIAGTGVTFSLIFVLGSESMKVPFLQIYIFSWLIFYFVYEFYLFIFCA